VISDDNQNSTAGLKPNEQPPVSPDSITSNPNTEVLLELVEECPLSPSLLLTASPMDVNPVIGIPKLSKGKGRARVNGSESKKKKSKRIHSNTKTSVGAASLTSDTSAKTLSTAADQG
jgi:hypothetical protein